MSDKLYSLIFDNPKTTFRGICWGAGIIFGAMSRQYPKLVWAAGISAICGFIVSALSADAK